MTPRDSTNSLSAKPPHQNVPLEMAFLELQELRERVRVAELAAIKSSRPRRAARCPKRSGPLFSTVQPPAVPASAPITAGRVGALTCPPT
jgi:hypothetical protein